ncbi:tRNA (uracil-5-)-methyltransferase homolog B isoform X2 [Anabrus simplex]|uniref:tRNA (uracil-5-)-methyltransferase homolog B isoform X2 n=1 Tax=Anabrus simplex TaxID=316456 RepID=UPI0035A37EE4
MATEAQTEIKPEAMEVDGDATEKVVVKEEKPSEADDSKNESMDSKMDESTKEDEKSEEPKVNGEEKATSKATGLFKVKVNNLPRFYPLGAFKKLVKEHLGLALNYVKIPKRGNPWLHLTFSTAEEQQRAVKALDQYMWRGKLLSCDIVTTDAQKRKPEDSAGEDSDAKKAKLDQTVDERVLTMNIPYHNIPYEEQLKKKTDELKTMVMRLGDLVVRRNPELAGWAEQQKEKHDGLCFQLEDIRPSPVIDAYRNKCEFRIGLNPDTQERTVGCRLENYKDGSMGVGPADSLKHLPDQMREAVKLFQEYVRKSDKEPYWMESRQGYWRHLVVRVTTTGEMMLVIVAHPQSLTDEELDKLKEDLKNYFVTGEGSACNVTSLYFQKFTEKLVGQPLPEMEHLYGKTHLEEVMLDLTFHLSPSSYFQVNTKGAEVLYSAIIELVEPNEDTTVLDLCCGTGGIGLCIAKKCGQVFGIEYLAQNVEDAIFNAKKNEITNCEFIAGRVEDILPTLDGKMTGKSIVPILDPPRTGLNQKVLSQLRKLENVQKIIYVCSNHKAPIRNFLDLCCPAGKNSMTGNPFVPVKTIPVDVVPHTMHAQMVILLERVDPTKLPKAKNPPPLVKKSMRGKGLLRGKGRGRGRGGRGRGSVGSTGRGIRGNVRGRGMGMGGNMRNLPLMQSQQQRMGYMGMPMGPPVREYGSSRPQMRSRNSRDVYMDGYGPSPLMERDYLPPLMSPYGSRPSRRSAGSLGFGDNLLVGNPAATAAAMLEREEMAYRAGLTRGLVGAATFGPPPDLYPQYGNMGGGVGGGRYKGSSGSSSRGGGKKQGNVSRDSRGRRGRGGRR